MVVLGEDNRKDLFVLQPLLPPLWVKLSSRSSHDLSLTFGSSHSDLEPSAL